MRQLKKKLNTLEFMFGNLFVESTFILIFQCMYYCYTYEQIIMKLLLGLLTVTVSQQNACSFYFKGTNVY